MVMRYLCKAAVLLLLLNASLADDADRPRSDRDILQEFYRATGGPSWKTNYGWEEDDDNICDWYGVVCEGEEDEELSEDSGRSRRRRLDGAPAASPAGSPVGAAGPAGAPAGAPAGSPAFSPAGTPSVNGGNGSFARSQSQVVGLSLKSNNLSGRVPTSLWQIANLHTLVLSFNDVEVTFTTASTTLQTLKIHSTTTTSVSGLQQFTSLTSLHMSGTKLGNVEIPHEILQLSGLKYLHMKQCELEGTIPDALADLPLMELDLHENNMAGTLPDSLGTMQSLRTLSLSRNNLEGMLPDFLESLENLEELYLERNNFEGPLLAFDTQVNLLKLYLNNNDLTGNIPPTFLDSIDPGDENVHVNLQHNHLGRLVPKSLDRLENIRLNILLADNLYTGYEERGALCDNELWMNGLVGTYGCAAIMCGLRLSNSLGRRTNNNVCSRCDNADTLGTTICLQGGDPAGVLQQLFVDTGGDHWQRNDKWFSPNTSYCDWFGVVCYSNSDEIERLELAGNNLDGTVPNTVYSLERLKSFNFGHNPKVVVPFDGMESAQRMFYINVAHTATRSFDGIENAHREFKVLIAHHNKIQGTIPKEILQVTSLEVLSMADCEIVGSLPTELGSLSMLQEIYLYDNNLQGDLPTELGRLKRLKLLSLANNHLSGTLPSEWDTGMVNLLALSIQNQALRGGGISGSVLPFRNSPNLTQVFLSNNKLEGTIPPNLMQQVNYNRAITVDLSSNQLTGTVPGALARFDNMNLLIQDNLIGHVDNSICAKDDWMNGNVRAFGCDAVACPEYTVAPGGRRQYDEQECTDCEDANARDIVGQTKCGTKDGVFTERNVLELLYEMCNGPHWIHQNNWNTAEDICTWHGVACDQAKSVVALVLGHNNMIGTLPTQLYTMPNLARLSVFSNNIHVNFEGIEKASRLTALILDNTNLRSVDGVGMARGLKELNVGDNRLSGPIPTELSRLKSLETLIIRNNGLTGSLPLWLGNLHELKALLADKNKFSGKLLSFDNFQHLTMLNISTNLLTGPIPRTFLLNSPREERMYIDVSANELTGTIPFDLERAEWLTLIAHDNKITGLDPRLCALENWNSGDAKKYGCNGILCPAGTYNYIGRQSSDKIPCEECTEEPIPQFMGSRHCGGRTTTSDATRILRWIVPATALLSSLLLIL